MGVDMVNFVDGYFGLVNSGFYGLMCVVFVFWVSG